MGEGGDQIMKNQGIENFRAQDHQGGSVFYLDIPLPSNFQVLTVTQSEEKVLRLRGAPPGKVGGIQPGIGGSVKFHCRQQWQATPKPTVL